MYQKKHKIQNIKKQHKPKPFLYFLSISGKKLNQIIPNFLHDTMN